MKRLVTIPILAIVVLLAMPGVTRANAASCSAAAVGGEKAPAVDTTEGTVAESGEQGYKCTAQWQAGLFIQYEAGGTWHYANETAPGFHPNTPNTFQPANIVFDWPLDATGQHITEPGWVWQPTASADTPVCSVNWRIEVDFYSSNTDSSGLHPVFQVNDSPATHKTC